MPRFKPRRRRRTLPPETVPDGRPLTAMQTLGRLRLVRNGHSWVQARRLVKKVHGWRKGLAKD